jgi:hypothetical protein
MSKLSEIQQAFSEAVLTGSHQAATAAIAPGQSALRSTALYRRLIRDNYMQVLKVTYPVLFRFVGERYWGIFARGYIKVYPSASGDLFPYGRHLPTFFKELKAPPLLAELARLEWVCHEVHQAADSPALSRHQLLAVTSVDPLRVTVRLHEAARLLRLSLPVHRVWLALQPEAPTDEVVGLPLPEEETVVVVTRGDGRVRVTPLAALDFLLLEAMAAGKTLADIERTAIEREPTFDLSGFFAKALNLRLISGFSVREVP